MPLPLAAVGTAIDIGKTVVSGITSIFAQKKPTPEEQKAKAGVWYSILRDLVINKLTPAEVSAKWEGSLPFGSKSTRKKWASDFKNRPSTWDHVQEIVDKINDELRKGGFAEITKAEAIAGLGGTPTVEDMSNISANVVTGGIEVQKASDVVPISETPEDERETKMYFLLFGGIMAIVVIILGFLAFGSKKKKR